MVLCWLAEGRLVRRKNREVDTELLVLLLSPYEPGYRTRFSSKDQPTDASTIYPSVRLKKQSWTEIVGADSFPWTARISLAIRIDEMSEHILNNRPITPPYRCSSRAGASTKVRTGLARGEACPGWLLESHSIRLQLCSYCKEWLDISAGEI